MAAGSRTSTSRMTVIGTPRVDGGAGRRLHRGVRREHVGAGDDQRAAVVEEQLVGAVVPELERPQPARLAAADVHGVQGPPASAKTSSPSVLTTSGSSTPASWTLVPEKPVPPAGASAPPSSRSATGIGAKGGTIPRHGAAAQRVEARVADELAARREPLRPQPLLRRRGGRRRRDGRGDQGEEGGARCGARAHVRTLRGSGGSITRIIASGRVRRAVLRQVPFRTSTCLLAPRAAAPPSGSMRPMSASLIQIHLGAATDADRRRAAKGARS